MWPVGDDVIPSVRSVHEYGNSAGVPVHWYHSCTVISCGKTTEKLQWFKRLLSKEVAYELIFLKDAKKKKKDS